MATGDRYLATFVDAVQHNPNLDGTDVLVFLEILCLASKSGVCSASYKRISEGSKCSVSSVYRSVSHLINLEYIHVREVSAKRPLLITPHPGFYRTKDKPFLNAKLKQLQPEVSKKTYYKKKEKDSAISTKFQSQNENIDEDPFMRERSSKTDCGKIDVTETLSGKTDMSGTVKLTGSYGKTDVLILSDRKKNINKSCFSSKLNPEQISALKKDSPKDWPYELYAGFSLMADLPNDIICDIRDVLLHSEIDKADIRNMCLQVKNEYDALFRDQRIKESEKINKKMSQILNGIEVALDSFEDDQDLI